LADSLRLVGRLPEGVKLLEAFLLSPRC